MAAKFTLEAIWRGVDRMTAPVTRMGNRVGKVTRAMRGNINKVNDAFKRVGRSAKGAFGVAGIAGAAFVAQRAIRAVVTTGADFEQTLVGAGARFDLSIRRGTAAFKELETVARLVGKTTEFTASEAAGALDFMAKAGLDTKRALALLPGIVDLATATNLDLARAADIVTDSISAFGLAADDAGQLQKNFVDLSNMMTKATLISNQNFEELFETVKKGVPAARAAGASIVELLASTAAFASAGLKAGDAGTAMKNIFLKLADVGVQKTLADLGGGVAVLDKLTRKIRPFADIMDDLVAATADLSKTERAGLIADLFGLRGVTGIVNVLSAGVPKFREFEERIRNSTNLTRDLASIMRDTVKNEMKALASAVESVQISFFKANQEGLSVFLTGLTDVTREIDDFVQKQPEIVLVGIKLAAFGVALLAVGLAMVGISAAFVAIWASPAALVALGALAIFAAESARGPQTVPGMGGAFNRMANSQRERLATERRETLLGPQDRIGRALDRLGVAGGLGTAELLIKAPGLRTELFGAPGSAFDISIDEFEDF